MRLLDLFSGIGGFSLAARWAGIETIQFVEIDKFCQKVLAKNFPGIPIHDDIKSFDANYLHGKVDILTGGFPCQPFSCAGKKKGFSDDRYLWPDMLRIIRECKPTWIIGENVSGIISHLDPILEDLENESYAWRAFLIPASAVHAPHKRERLWIIANRDGERFNERGDIGKERSIQSDWKWNVATIQSEWTQFQPFSWTTFNAQEWLGISTDSKSIRCASTNSREEGNRKNKIECGAVNVRTSSGSTIFNWEEDKPPIPGVDVRVSERLDFLNRNKAIGNCVVPQIPFIFMKIIKAIENDIS